MASKLNNNIRFDANQTNEQNDLNLALANKHLQKKIDEYRKQIYLLRVGMIDNEWRSNEAKSDRAHKEARAAARRPKKYLYNGKVYNSKDIFKLPEV